MERPVAGRYWWLLTSVVATAVLLVIVGVVTGWGYWTGVLLLLAVITYAVAGIALGVGRLVERSRS